MSTYTERITHEDFLSSIDWLANEIRCKFPNYKSMRLCPIPRGGLVPCGYLAHKLNMDVVSLSQVIQDDDPNIILVEDIVDTGGTIDDIHHFLSADLIVACVCTKRHTPKINGVEVIAYDLFPSNAWVVFPWETEESAKR